MKRSTLFLKLAIILIGIPVLALASLLWMGIGGTAIRAAGDGLTLGYVISAILVGVTLSMIPFYAALIQAYKLVTYIDEGKSFSQLAVKALEKIKQYAFIISGIYVAILPLVFIVAQWDDAPGLILVGATPAFAAFVVAIFSTVLEYLLEEVINIKSENDLTI